MGSAPYVQSELPARKSLAILAVLVVFIVLFSYVFTLALAAACVILPYLMLASPGIYTSQVIILFGFGVIMAGTLVWSIIPRRDAFKEPGPSMTQSAQPRLFAEIEKIANALGEPLPDAVYLVPDVNAWVAKRGGVMGFGGKRILGLGLPLLATLSTSQFRAILAHEFGHYYSGDTKLGPLMYGARSVMVRTFTNIAGRSELLRVLDHLAIANFAHRLIIAVMQGYWKLFMRAAQWISRRQEYRADELACAVAGSDALMGSLRRIAASSTAQQLFWQSQILPALQSGFRLPIGEGFARFVAMPNIATAASGTWK